MDKRTLLAVLLSVIVMTGGYLIQNKLAPPTPTTENTSTTTVDNTEKIPEATTAAEKPVDSGSIKVVEENIPPRTIEAETSKYKIIFSNTGASVKSLILKEYKDYNNGKTVDMINSSGTDLTSFNMSFDGNYNEVLSQNFHYEDKGNGVFQFYRDFTKKKADGSAGETYRIVKTYTFSENEYIFKVDINVINAPFRSYSLDMGPDIGPTFIKLDNRNEYRRYYSYADGKKSNHKLKGNSETINNQVKWASINGKYFSLIIAPERATSSITWERNKVEGLDNSSELHLENTINSSDVNDSFYVYAGPKSTEYMTVFNNAADNAFGLSEMNFNYTIDSSTIPGLGWLSNLLKYVLLFFNKLIPNYGVAIILLTLLIKIIFYPVTHKSFESTSKMQEIQPKLKKLQEQYKSDPQKLNTATAELYKKEGVNPLGGCLPMLIQMPIFFALYGLLNSYFGLRGASFIPGWINNLSSPESVYTLPFAIPILNWTNVRILPFLYLGTQLVMSSITQAGSAATGAQSNAQMKMLTLGMPIMFFFILYDMPSGLLLYWTVTNLLSAVQQYIINKKRAVAKAS